MGENGRSNHDIEPQSAGAAGGGVDAHTDPDVPQDVLELAEMLEAIPWRVAASLLKLREQVNELAPGRGRASDGTIGDADHRKRSSDHNPHVLDGGTGVVTAMDITHDPGRGCDAGRLAESLRASRDPRVKYIIWNRRIANASPVGGQPAWARRPYGGANPHDHHVHISVQPEKARYDSTARWALAVT